MVRGHRGSPRKARLLADLIRGKSVDTALNLLSESRIDEGMVIKRFQPKDRGRAHPILKPLSHITVSVEERSSKK
ncbi:MAG: uL22 family ribosomal protein [Planctomycetota bacterium]|nr:uL22 family ribosomal protein [Planctomycetota bacterium]